MPNKILCGRLDKLEKDVDAMVVLSAVCSKIDSVDGVTSSSSSNVRTAAKGRRPDRCCCPTSKERILSRDRTDPTQDGRRVFGNRSSPTNRRAGSIYCNSSNSNSNHNNNNNNNSAMTLKQRVTSRTQSEPAPQATLISRSTHHSTTTRGKENSAKDRRPHTEPSNKGLKARGDVTSSDQSTALSNNATSSTDVVSEVSSQPSSGSEVDVTPERLDAAVRKLEVADCENAKLKDLLEDNRVTIKELSQSKAVALNLAKQLKERYDVLKSQHDLSLKRYSSSRAVCSCCGATAQKELSLIKQDNERKRVLDVLKNIEIDYGEDDGDDDDSSRGPRTGVTGDDHVASRGQRSGVMGDDEQASSEATERRHRVKELEMCLKRKEEENERLRLALEEKEKDDVAHKRYLQERNACEELKREAAEKDELTSKHIEHLSNSLNDHANKIVELTEINMRQENLLTVQQKSLVSKAKGEEVLNRLANESTALSQNTENVDGYEAELMNHKSKIDNLMRALSDLEAVCSDAQHKAHNFEMEVNALKMKIKSAEKISADLQLEKDRQIQRLSAALSERDKKMAEFQQVQSELHTAEKSLSRMVDEIGELKSALREMNGDEKDLQVLRKRCQREIADKENELKQLKNTLQEMEGDGSVGDSAARRERCMLSIKRTEDDVNKLREALGDMENGSSVCAVAAVERLAARRVADAERRCEDAEKRVDDAGRRLGATERMLKEAEQKVAEANARLAGAEAKATEAEKRLKHMEEKMKELEAEAKKACDCAREATEREASLHELTQRLNSASEIEINSYKTELDRNEKENRELANRCKELEKEIKELKQNIEEYEGLVECRCADKENELKELKEVAVERESKLKGVLTNMISRYEDLTNEAMELKTKMTDMNALTKHQENLLAMQQQLITNKDEEIQLANAEVEAIRRKSAELDGHLKSLRRSFDAFEEAGGAENLEAVKLGYEKSLDEGRQQLETERTECAALKRLTEEKVVLVEMLQDDLKEKSEQMTEVLQELEREKQASVRLADRLADLRREIEVREAELATAKRSVGELQKRIAEEGGVLEAEKDKLKIKDKIIEDQAATIKQLKEQVKPLEKQLATVALKNAQLLNEIKDLKWQEDDLRSQLHRLAAENHRLEENNANEANTEECERQSRMLSQLENQVHIKQMEWEQEISKLRKEKANADNSARYATRKLVETVTNFKQQIAAHQKVQQSLASLVQEKDALLLTAKQKQCESVLCCRCVTQPAAEPSVVAAKAPDGSKTIKPVKILLAAREQRGVHKPTAVGRRESSWGSGKYVIHSR